VLFLHRDIDTAVAERTHVSAEFAEDGCVAR
jgi:hypothetical protein